jgi:uncharacterized membrane protein YdjX (TVP38/TMEM64 family)
MSDMVIDPAAKRGSRIHWGKLAITIISFLALSIGFAYVLNILASKFDLPLYDYAWAAYLTVFVVSLVANLTILVLVPFAASFMIAAATAWDPILVALVASIGGTLGELSSYFVGRLGKKLAVAENTVWFSKIEGWTQRYGMWAMSFMALQPVIPFDLAGLIAGAAKMPVWKYLTGILIGKFPKYIVVTLAGIGVIKVMPFLAI